MSLFKAERLAQINRRPDVAPTHAILIVDDEAGNLRVLRVALAERFRVLEATDGQHALELLQSLPPDQGPSVILSDQRMPRMTGVELFEKVRELLPDSIRIIITGFVDVGAIVDAINRAGIYKFVVKPFDRNELLLTVDRAIEAFEMRRKILEHIEQLEHKVRERTRELEAKNEALQDAYAEIERASLTDPLTGLGNRRSFNRRLDQAPEQRRGQGQRLAYLLIDLDHFKSVNDGYGHAAGDAVLSKMGEILQQNCRGDDLAVRWGGEEFLLRIDVDDELEALACAERVRQQVRATDFALSDGQILKRTCSIGIACQPFLPDAPESLNWEHVLSLADAALYLAKKNGRDASFAILPGPFPADDLAAQINSDLTALLQAGALQVRAGDGRQVATLN